MAVHGMAGFGLSGEACHRKDRIGKARNFLGILVPLLCSLCYNKDNERGGAQGLPQRGVQR